ncbi:MAG: tyrosine-type recombinase/integrase [Flavobacteriales bacterium]|nr:tyrosine-type recombinase/integrase [Flavobacteriales bacterium]
MKLGKTKDSRTRKQPVKAVNIAEQEKLLNELKNQQEFTQYLLYKGYSTSTTKRYVKDAEMFIKWAAKENVQIEEVSYSDVLHYIQSKRNHVKQRTISTTVNSLKHYFNYLSTINQNIENPTTQIQIKGVKRKTLYHILSKQELESLYNNFELPDENSKYKNHNWFKTSQLASKRNKVILGLIIYQGLGSVELGRITEKDIKLREGKIYIAGTRKSNQRELKLEAHQILDIMEYTLKIRNEILTRENKTSEILFVSVGKSDRINNIINKLIKKLNKQNSKITSVKQIRASVITHWLKNYNLRQVQYMAGHRYVSSTEAYFVNDLDDLQEDISKFHPIG